MAPRRPTPVPLVALLASLASAPGCDEEPIPPMVAPVDTGATSDTGTTSDTSTTSDTALPPMPAPLRGPGPVPGISPPPLGPVTPTE